jgi:spoIIIJ-associated protein
MKDNEFKGVSVEEAKQNGLESLGLTENEADIEIIKEGGVFSKATVIVKPKEEKQAEEIEKPVVEKSNALVYLEEMLQLMNMNVSVQEKEINEEKCFYISGESASSIIGHRGETLDSIQYLVSQFVNKGKPFEEHTRVNVDADFYREKRIRTLISLAKRLGNEASRTNKEIALEPMNSYERRIIHSALQDSEEAMTKSEGEGKERYVVIMPKGESISYGSDSEFKKNGPARTRSFGYAKKKF